MSTRLAAVWMSGAIVSFSAMAVAGRAVSIELDTFELMLYRSLIGIVIVLTVMAARRRLAQIRAERMQLHLTRNLFHFAGQNLWFYAIATIPLAQVVALEFTSPIWVALAAPFLLAERLTRTRMIVALLGFIGVLIVARPSLDGVGTGQIAAALAAVGFAGSAVATKILTRTQPIGTILFWLTILQAGMGLICAGYDGNIAVPGPGIVPWLLLIGAAGLSAHLCLTTALTLAPATVVMPMDFLRLPILALIGALVYAEALDPLVLAGAVLILAANYFNIWSEGRRVRQPV